MKIIPLPVELKKRQGNFTLNGETVIQFSKSLEKVSDYFVKLVSPSTGYNFVKTDNINQNKENAIILNILTQENNELGNEGYILDINEKSLIISANKPNGIFYGIQTLRQLLPIEIESKHKVINENWNIPCCFIKDYPRFSWRGYMLDCCRHFWTIETIKRMIDLIALHKLNIFHWHLTEDQGWRIEIKKYPKLAEIGSVRELSEKNGETPNLEDPTKYGGYYTQEQVKEVIKYAADRFIQVIPEIEMPGHSSAAVASYPELGCTKGPYTIPSTWGIFKEVYCAGREKVFTFLEDVLDEVMELFPSEIIHTGGDEVPKNRWKECEDCQQRIKDENLKDEEALQTYFTNRISKYLKSKNRRLMGWNEILNNGLAENAVCHWWMGPVEPIVDELRKGRDIVVSKSSHIYLDHRYKNRPLSRAYAFDPIPDNLESKYHDKILGIEAPLWTERVTTQDRIDFQTFPRLTAVAETSWTPKEKKDYYSFMDRLKSFNIRLERLGVKVPNENQFEPNILKRLLIKLKKS